MIRFEPKDVDVHDVPGQHLIVQQLPRLCRDRYSNISQSIFVRDCSGKLYTIVSRLMYPDLLNGVTLFNGVTGIGKSLFLVYFNYWFLQDNRFQRIWSGNCWYFQPNSETTLFPCTLQLGNYLWRKDFLLFCDISNPVQPLSRAKRTFIFSSPCPLKYIMPTWNELELMFGRYWSVEWEFRPLWRSAPICVAQSLWDQCAPIVGRGSHPDGRNNRHRVLSTPLWICWLTGLLSAGSYQSPDVWRFRIRVFRQDCLFVCLWCHFPKADGEAQGRDAGWSGGNVSLRDCIVAASLSGDAAIIFDAPVESHSLPLNWVM